MDLPEDFEHLLGRGSRRPIPGVKFVAELEGVHEVSLTGVADLDYWRRQLAPEGLVPLEREGRAQILIVAADATFRGLRFQEMSFSVLAAPADAQDRQGAFLVQAFTRDVSSPSASAGGSRLRITSGKCPCPSTCP